MPFFEVYIPAGDASGANVTLTVESKNWLGALQSGLVNSGEDPSAIANVMCDLQGDGSIHVTDSARDRVFRLREVESPDSNTTTQPQMPAVKIEGQRFQGAAPAIARSETQPQPSDPSIGRAPSRVVERTDVDDVIADIFERAMDLFTERLNPDRIVNDLLDLALEKIPSDSGSFYVASISEHDLQFAAVRGPKSQEILEQKIRVPMGQGIAGFCAAEAVALAVNDAQNDPRFAREISEKIGYDVHSTICVPLDKEGRSYGAIQLINHQGGTAYSQGDLNILTAVGRQAVDLLSQVQV